MSTQYYGGVLVPRVKKKKKKSYVGVIKSYVRGNIAYVGLIISYVGEKSPRQNLLSPT